MNLNRFKINNIYIYNVNKLVIKELNLFNKT